MVSNESLSGSSSSPRLGWIEQYVLDIYDGQRFYEVESSVRTKITAKAHKLCEGSARNLRQHEDKTAGNKGSGALLFGI